MTYNALANESDKVNIKEVFPILPFEYIEQHKAEVQRGIDQRWANLLKLKSSFNIYSKKTDQEIIQEFNELHALRFKLWYHNPNNLPRVSNIDYIIAQDLLEKGYYRTINNIPFSYNRTDSTYNASTILINDQHFIAMQEPNMEILPQFFKLIINHHVSNLVRLKPEHEYVDKYSIKYWEGRLSSARTTLLKIDIPHSGKNFVPVQVPYFFTEDWVDDKAMGIEVLTRLVGDVKVNYDESSDGPVACHCASGVGRTGTFIAAMVLSNMIDKGLINKISIEEIVLKLSIQRPNMVATTSQYLMLYRYVDSLI